MRRTGLRPARPSPRAVRALGFAAAAVIVCALGTSGPLSAATAPPAAIAASAAGANAPIDFALFPPGSPWNADVSTMPVDPRSATYLASMGTGTALHPDFGTVWNGAPNGIPYVLVHGLSQRRYPATFYYGDESDPGPYPIPPDAPVEGGPNGAGDRHVLALDVDNRMLYELYDARFNAARGRWEAGSGAIWDVNAVSVRPDGWTSADAAGLPMLPGLVRFDEVQRGEITHALRFTVPRTQRKYLYPATHFASDSTDPSLPPMGLRVRLKAGYDISRFPAEVQVILRALKKYGMIVADNGGAWYVSGAPDARWNDDALHAITQVRGSDFEVVDARALEPTAPVAYAGRDAEMLRARTAFARSGCFADPRGTRWTATVSYGDGSAPAPLTLTSDKRFRLSHAFRRPGRFRVTVRVTNDRGATGTATFYVRVRRR